MVTCKQLRDFDKVLTSIIEKIYLGKHKPVMQWDIVQEDKKGNFIAEFKNAADASLKTGVKQASIWNCTSGRSRSAGGYVFYYKYK